MTPEAYQHLVAAFRLVFGYEPENVETVRAIDGKEYRIVRPPAEPEQPAPSAQIETIQVTAAEMVELVLTGVNMIATTPAAQAIIRDRTERLFAAAVPSVHVGEQGSIAPCYRVSLNMWRYLADEYWRVPA